jgi:hypothetical protein
MSSRIPKYKKKALIEIKTICRIHQNKFDIQASWNDEGRLTIDELWMSLSSAFLSNKIERIP